MPRPERAGSLPQPGHGLRELSMGPVELSRGLRCHSRGPRGLSMGPGELSRGLRQPSRGLREPGYGHGQSEPSRA